MDKNKMGSKIKYPLDKLIKRLTRDEERDLFRRWEEEKEIDVLNVIMESYIPFVKYIADAYFNGISGRVEFYDLVSAGVLGLYSAVERFDLSKTTRFTNYAVKDIKSAIINGIHDSNIIDIKSTLQERVNKIRHLLEEGYCRITLLHSHGRDDYATYLFFEDLVKKFKKELKHTRIKNIKPIYNLLAIEIESSLNQKNHSVDIEPKTIERLLNELSLVLNYIDPVLIAEKDLPDPESVSEDKDDTSIEGRREKVKKILFYELKRLMKKGKVELALSVYLYHYWKQVKKCILYDIVPPDDPVKRNNFVLQINGLLEKNKLTQEDIGVLLGVSHVTVGNYLDKAYRPIRRRLKFVYGIFHTLEVSE